MEAYSTLITDECYRLIYFIKRRIRSEQGLKEVMDKMPGNGIYCVYGGGKFGKECIDFLQMLPVTIKNIYDKNSNKKEVCGIPIVRPDKETLEKKIRIL